MPERIVYFYIKKVFSDAINGFAIKHEKKIRTVDIFIPSLNLAIEYDGSRWHKNPLKDIEKSSFLREIGIDIVRIREHDCPNIDDDSYHIIAEYTAKSYRYLTPVIQEIFTYVNFKFGLNVVASIDIENDYYIILRDFALDKKEKSLANVNPALAQEWDFQKNRNLTPHQILATSNKRFWWTCKKCGYSWRSTAYDRNNGHGCPACAGLTVYTGFNDLHTMRPKLITEWDYSKNTLFCPSEVSYRSNKKVWWICEECGYSWQARIADRSAGVGCPACARKVAVAGITDLATINPVLALDWDYDKNNGLTPQCVLGGSNKKVWWKCNTCQHSWQAYIYSRHIDGRGCPECAKQKRKKKDS